MAADMKTTIAEAAVRLLKKNQRRRLTVKDIVEECHITRQAFYYHFADIPELFKWMLERGTERMISESRVNGDPESALKYFFLVGINAGPSLKKGLHGAYGEEREQLMDQYVYGFLEQFSEEAGLYQDCSVAERRLILRYHSGGIMWLLKGWTEADTKNLDHIVGETYRMMKIFSGV